MGLTEEYLRRQVVTSANGWGQGRKRGEPLGQARTAQQPSNQWHPRSATWIKFACKNGREKSWPKLQVEAVQIKLERIAEELGFWVSKSESLENEIRLLKSSEQQPASKKPEIKIAQKTSENERGDNHEQIYVKADKPAKETIEESQ